MKAMLITALALVLPACGDNKAEILERQYSDIAKHDPLGRQRCDLGKQIAAVWLDRGNEEKYREWKLTSDIECQNASLRAGTGL